MKTSKILDLSLEEFNNELSLLNLEYIIVVYKSIVRAYICYQEMADASTNDDFLGINEYFNIDRENNKEYKEYLKELS